MRVPVSSLWKVGRFLISGGISAVVNLGLLSVFTEKFHIWYIVSACLSFIFAFVVSFLLQKFWTFRDVGSTLVGKQMVTYFAIAVTNLGIDIAVLYVLVEYGHVHYLLAQFITMAVIAFISYFIYQRFVFTSVAKVEMEVEDAAHIEHDTIVHLIIIFAAAIFFSLAPYVWTAFTLGGNTTVPVGVYNDADYYFERMKEVKDGHPLLGNPYFYEHRNDPPPAFVGADWLSAIPLFVGLSMTQTMYLNFFGWSFVFMLIGYALFRALRLGSVLSLVGSIALFAQVYLFMIRPVSMQVVFPFFLFSWLAMVLWLFKPSDRMRQILFGGSSAVAAALYTYAGQIHIVTLALLWALALFVRRDLVKPLLIPSAVFAAVLAPFIYITIAQTRNPNYAETIARIGLQHTHIPISSAFYIVTIPLILGLLAFLFFRFKREHFNNVHFVFFISTGIALMGVMLSNVITGLDLELPQHIERFVILWFVSGSIALWLGARAFFSERHGVLKKVIALVLMGGIALWHGIYFRAYGPPILLFAYSSSYMKSVQDIPTPLAWLDAYAAKSTSTPVVWVDPDGIVFRYLSSYSKEYTLWHASGALHLVSDAEVRDRYLTAHYFALTPEKLVSDYQAYGGVGNAIHGWKNWNRAVWVCKISNGKLKIENWNADSCGEYTDLVHFKGEKFFSDAHQQFLDDQKNIKDKLAQYQVNYIISDNVGDTSTFKPETLPFVTKIYSDSRFEIYAVN